MKAWQRGFLYILVLNAAVRCVTSLEEEIADSIFGEFTLKTKTRTFKHRRAHSLSKKKVSV